MTAHLTPTEALDHSQPTCQRAGCGQRIWYNPRKRSWWHYDFEIDDHEARP